MTQNMTIELPIRENLSSVPHGLWPPQNLGKYIDYPVAVYSDRIVIDAGTLTIERARKLVQAVYLAAAMHFSWIAYGDPVVAFTPPQWERIESFLSREIISAVETMIRAWSPHQDAMTGEDHAWLDEHGEEVAFTFAEMAAAGVTTITVNYPPLKRVGL